MQHLIAPEAEAAVFYRLLFEELVRASSQSTDLTEAMTAWKPLINEQQL